MSVIAWLAHETTQTTGSSSDYALDGPLNASYAAFADVLANLDPAWFVVHGDGQNFEVNADGVYNAILNTLSRNVLFSTAGVGIPVNWATGVKSIYGIIPVFDPSDFLRAANNLSDLNDIPTALVNLGLTALATEDPANFDLVLKIIAGSGGRLVIPIGNSLWAT